MVYAFCMRSIQRNRDYVKVGNVFRGTSKPWAKSPTLREITAVDWENGHLSWKQVGDALHAPRINHAQRPDGTMKIVSFMMWADCYVSKAELAATDLTDLVKVEVNAVHEPAIVETCVT